MSDEFSNTIERDTGSKNNFESRPRSNSKETKSEPTANNIIELLSGGKSITELAETLNLNPDLTSKVLMPLANIVQKYQVGKSVADSKTGQAAGDLLSVLGDVAPIIQGLTDYLAGQRKQLADEDLAYLDAIKSAQSNSDLSSLFADDGMMSIGDEIVEETVEEPVDPRTAQRREVENTLGASLPDDWDVTKGIDWAVVLGSKPKSITKGGLGFTSMEEIQAEADRLNGKTVLADSWDLTKGLSMDASLVPATSANPFMSMTELIAEAGLSYSDAETVSSEGTGGFKSPTSAPVVAQKVHKSTTRPVAVPAPTPLLEVSLDMDEFMSVAEDLDQPDDEEIMYLSDEEVEELRAEGFIFDELDEVTKEE